MTTPAELAKAVQDGSPEAMAELYDLYKARVFSVSYAILRSRSDAEDVTQETFMRAMERIAQLRDTAQIAAWLCSISRSTSLDLIRSNKDVLVEEWPGLETQTEIDPTTGLRQAEAAALVAAAFGGLSPRDRAALELAELQELTGADLALALDVKRDHAYNLVAHARERFADSVTALMVCRQGRETCTELDALLSDWSGELDPTTRKRVNRHISNCTQCADTKKRVASPAALLSLLPVVAISQEFIRPDFSLISHSSTDTQHTKEPIMSANKQSNLILGVAASAVLIAAIAYFTLGSSDASTAQAPASETTVTIEPQAPATTNPQDAATTTVETSVLESTTTVAVLTDDYCKVAFEFRSELTEGPASVDVADVELYFTRNQGYYERLLELSPDDVHDNWSIFTRAHGGLVNHLRNNGWAMSAAATYPINDPIELSSDTVQTHLEVYCGVPGFYFRG